jgi:predicted nucleic acid-binding protein
MNIVLDTNVLLVSIGRKSRFNPIFEALLQNKFNLFVSNEILLEYTEILEKRANPIIARDVLDALIIRPNVHF